MKISSLRFQPYSLPFARPFRTARETLRRREGFLVWVSDGEGAWGVGEAAPLAGYGMEPLHETGKALQSWAGSLPGRAAALSLPLAEDTPPAFGLAEDFPGCPAARHGLELALLDLAARRAGLPLAKALHPGAAETLSVNAVLGGASPEETVAEAAARAAEGYGTLKIKLGMHGPQADQALLSAIRAAVGAPVRLRLDANEGWTEREALPLLERLAPIGIEYVEQPLPAGDLPGMARLARKSPIPLAADEAVLSLSGARAILDAQAAQLLILKPMALGGLLSTLAVARLAASRGVRVVVTTTLDGACARMGAACAAAALPGIPGASAPDIAHGLATGHLLAKDLLPDPPRPMGGLLTLPKAAGLGISLAPPSGSAAPPG
ncbi:MAG: o-succinylbenzoate synthase [SAR324 cluster bacterium]|nr:o-succinylbenzoate synthase [SAR324 cluster bacterium]